MLNTPPPNHPLVLISLVAPRERPDQRRRRRYAGRQAADGR